MWGLSQEIPREHLLKYIGGDVDVNFNWVPPEEGENDLQNDKTERKRRWDNHRRLCSHFEKVTRQWAASKGQEGGEERRILAKRLRLSHFDYEPYWLGKWVHHRNGDLPLTNPGIVRFQYPMANGEKIRQILGHEDSRKSILRELQEIAVGAPVDFVEAKTKQLLKDGKWGQWDTCEDLPAPPTGFKDGQLIYDENPEAAALIDVIGLNGPETLQAAKAQVAEQGAPATSRQKSNGATPDGTALNGTAASQTDVATAVQTEKTPEDAVRTTPPKLKEGNTATTQANKTEKVDNSPKGSFFQSLKKKVYA